MLRDGRPADGQVRRELPHRARTVGEALEDRAPLPYSDLWPSNHTTAVAAAGLSLVLIFRGRLRYPAALLALGMCVGITSMLLIRGTHLLSDVVAALLVAGFWAVVGAQVLAAHASS